MIILKNYFCYELTTGGRIIGWTGFALSLLTILIFIFEYFYYYNIDEPTKNLNETMGNINKSIESMDEDGPSKPDHLTAIFIVCLVYEIIIAITSLVLIIGIKKRNHIFLLPWLIVFGSTFICTPIIMFISVYILNMTYLPSISLLTSLIYAITLVVFFYTWLAVYNLYKHFKSNTPLNRELSEKQMEEN